MSISRYPKCQDSGIEWVGEIPAHWQILPLFECAGERDESNVEMLQDNLLSLSYGKIIRKDIASNDGLLPESFETYQIVHPGDLVLRLTDLQNDKRSLRTAIVEEDGIITSAYLALKPEHIRPRYLNHLLRAYDLTKVFYSMGGGLRQSMKFSDMKRLPLLLPPSQEQDAIASFLDHETAKIDALIAEQERLIELLNEKRQALISRAVTKGLNPDAPMKESGIEWLGRVPRHWDVCRIKHLARLISKGTTPTTIGGEFTESGIRFLKAENITEKGLSPDPAFFIDEQTHQLLLRSSLEEEDVVVVIAGATTGRVGRVGRDFLPCNTNQAVAFIRPSRKDFAWIISTWLSVPKVREALLLTSVQSAQPNLSMEDLGNCAIAVPAEEERTAIENFVESEERRMSRVCNETWRSLSLLRERRAALIFAAVTGKIDVRGLASTGSKRKAA